MKNQLNTAKKIAQFIDTAFEKKDYSVFTIEIFLGDDRIAKLARITKGVDKTVLEITNYNDIDYNKGQTIVVTSMVKAIEHLESVSRILFIASKSNRISII